MIDETTGPRERLRDRWRYDQREAWHRLAATCFDSSACVLDIGCGRGAFLKYAGERAVGLDLNPDSLRHAHEKTDRLVRAGALMLPVGDATVDGVHCSHLIEHLVPSEVHRLLGEIDRVLKPGGVLVVRSPLMWSSFYHDLSHIRPYPPETIRNYLVEYDGQRTMAATTAAYEEVDLRYRHKPLVLHIPYVDFALQCLNRWGFPWLKRTGYMQVLRKREG